MKTQKLKKQIEEEKFWLAVKELTLFLKENKKYLTNLFKNNEFYPNKDVTILQLSLENLSLKFNEVLK